MTLRNIFNNLLLVKVETQQVYVFRLILNSCRPVKHPYKCIECTNCTVKWSLPAIGVRLQLQRVDSEEYCAIGVVGCENPPTVGVARVLVREVRRVDCATVSRDSQADVTVSWNKRY